MATAGPLITVLHLRKTAPTSSPGALLGMAVRMIFTISHRFVRISSRSSFNRSNLIGEERRSLVEVFRGVLEFAASILDLAGLEVQGIDAGHELDDVSAPAC